MDPRTADSVGIFEGESMDPRTADLVGILKGDEGIHGPSIWSKFIKGKAWLFLIVLTPKFLIFMVSKKNESYESARINEIEGIWLNIKDSRPCNNLGFRILNKNNMAVYRMREIPHRG